MKRRVVVVGYGMVGARFLDDLDSSAPPGELDVTVLGEEPYDAYNRVLLSEVIAGRADLNRLSLGPAPAGATVLRDNVAVRIDRRRRVVVDSRGGEHVYDVLVLATGARSRIPAIEGIRENGELAHGVRALRTLDDARGIVAAAVPGRQIVVLGGGVLGTEIACGLQSRGCEVRIVQAAPRLMSAQFDDESAGAVQESLVQRGIEVELNAQLAEVLTDSSGRVAGVRLTDGTTHRAEMLLVAAGVTPNVQIAEEAGLSVDFGILTDAEHRSVDDDTVYAIGDCAQPPTGHFGLVAPGWEHARRVARRLGGAPQVALAADDRRGVVRLKAAGLDAVALGDAADLRRTPGRRVVRLSDGSAGRSVTVAVRGGRIEAAACVGAPQVAALLTTMYEREMEVPDDPAHLLVDPLRASPIDAQQSPTRIPDSATLCRCNGVTKKAVIGAFREGARTLHQMSVATRATTGCGGCVDTVAGVIEWLVGAEPSAESTSLTSPDVDRERDVARR